METEAAAAPEPKIDLEVLRHLHETERKSSWDAANLLAKGTGFYLAISASVLTYILTRTPPPPFPRRIAAAGLVVTVLFAIALAAGSQALIKQGTVVQQLTRKLSEALPAGTVPIGFPQGTRRVSKVLALCTFGLLMLLTCYFIWLMRA
jgi:hypothetical protein